MRIHAGPLFHPTNKLARTRCGKRLPDSFFSVVGGPDVNCKACLKALRARMFHVDMRRANGRSRHSA